MREGYYESPLGIIPQEWEVITVKDATVEHKQGYYTKEEYCKDGIKLVRITDLENPKVNFSNMPCLRISEKDYEDFKIQIGDFLFARSGAIGRYGIVEQEPEPAVFASYLIRFRFDQSYLINRYFGYFFESSFCSKQLSSIAQGNANININAENIKSLKVPLPPLPEQKKIAKILSTVDDKIEVIGEQIEQLQELKKGLMQRFLTNGIGHTQFKESPLGQIPVSWETPLLDKVSKRGSGHTPNKNFPEYYNGGVKWISLGDSSALDNRWITQTKINISEEGIKNSSAVLHSKGTVLMSRDAGVGKSAVMAESMAVSQHFITWTCGDRLDNWFLYYYLQYQKPYFERIAVGSTIKTIGLPLFKKLMIPLPCLKEQRQISEVLFSVDDKIDVLKNKRNQYQALKKGLMQQLLTGKLRVNYLIEQTELA